MEFHQDKLYHIFNRGNNKQPIFFYLENYVFLLKKVRSYIKECCDIIAYTLMPNYSHFVIYADIRTIQFKKRVNQEINVLSEGFRNLLCSYAQAVNKKNKTTGSLFQQNTKSKCLNDGSINHAQIAFHYIHHNAVKAGLVRRMEEWEYLSFKDYARLRNGTLCNKELAFQLLDLNEETFYKDSYGVIINELINKIF